MPDQISSASEMRRTGGRFVGGGIAAVVAIILIGAGLLLWALPDANAFNAQVERIFVENDDLTTQAEIKLLEILAQSGTAFSETLSSYRIVIIVLLVAIPLHVAPPKDHTRDAGRHAELLLDLLDAREGHVRERPRVTRGAGMATCTPTGLPLRIA